MAFDHAPLGFAENFDPSAGPAVYCGVRYRSRLAAEWAVFLDALGIEHVRQPKAFRVARAVEHAPDFWLPELKAWLDVLPADPVVRGAQRWKADEVAKQRPGERVWVASGAPRRREWHIEQLGGAGPRIARGMLLIDAVAPGGRVWMCGAAGEDSDRLIFDPIEKLGASPAPDSVKLGRPADPESDSLMRLAYGRVETFSAETWTSLGMAAERRLAALKTGTPAFRQSAA
jgi:hypothetical protein